MKVKSLFSVLVLLGTIVILPIVDLLQLSWQSARSMVSMIVCGVRTLPATAGRLPLWLVFLAAMTVVPWFSWHAVQFVAWAAGVVRHVDPTAGTCVGNYSIALRNCTGSDGNSYATIALGLAATTAGDTLKVRQGTYAVRITGAIPSGVSSLVKTRFEAYTGETVTINPSTATPFSDVILITGQDNIVIQGFSIDGAGVTRDGIKLDSLSDGIEILSNEIKNAPGQCLYVGRVTGNVVRKNDMHHCGVDEFEHGIYYNAATNGIIEENKLHDNSGSGIQIYPESKGTQFRRNKVYNNCRGASVTTGSQVIISYQNNIVEYNEIYETEGSCTNGILVNNASPLNAIIRQNSIYCAGNCIFSTGAGVKVNQGTGAIVVNNVISGYSNATINNATGTVFTTNLTSGIATDLWISPSTGDLHLKAGSPAINGGTDIGLAFNQGAPDQGAYESFTATGGTITGNVASLQVSMALNTPLVPGTTGWTVNNGRTVTGVALQGSSTVLLTFSGAACSGESWTASYSGGTAADSLGQPLFTLTNVALTNLCTGAPSYTFTQSAGAIYEALASQETSRLLSALAHGGGSPGSCFAVRTKFKATGADPPPTTTKLRVSTDGENGTYVDVPDTFGAANIKYIGQINLKGLPLHTTPLIAERLTSEFSGIVAGSVDVCATGCQTPASDLAQNSETEHVDIVCTDTDAGSTTYHFRRYLTDGTAMTYAVGSTPSITLTPARSSGMGF